MVQDLDGYAVESDALFCSTMMLLERFLVMVVPRLDTDGCEGKGGIIR